MFKSPLTSTSTLTHIGFRLRNGSTLPSSANSYSLASMWTRNNNIGISVREIEHPARSLLLDPNSCIEDSVRASYDISGVSLMQAHLPQHSLIVLCHCSIRPFHGVYGL